MKTNIITINQVLLLLLLITGCSFLTNAIRRAGRQKRISEGFTVKEGQFPSFVGLKGVIPSKPDVKETCGGDLIMKDLILTAGQCFLDEEFKIFAAPSIYHPDLWEKKGVKSYEVEKRCLSDDFKMPKSIPSHPSHDYQMLRLKTPILGVNFSRAPRFKMEIGRRAIIVGLGPMQNGKPPDSIQGLHVDTVDCEDASADELSLCFDSERSNGHTCIGDAGSPAYVKSKAGNQILVGLASTPPESCKKGQRELSLFTNINKALDGIRKIKRECEGK